MMQNLSQARKSIEKAIKLHRAHMNGTEPTNEKSQQILMKYIESVASALDSHMSHMKKGKKMKSLGF